MRRARSIWSRRRHNLAEARRAESVTAALDPPLSARQGSGLASRARTRAGGAIALSGAPGLSTGPHLHFEVYPNRDAVGPLLHPGSKIQSAASLKGPVIATAAVASPPAPGVISACNAAAFRAVFTPVLATFRQENGAPTRSNIGIESRRRGHSEREAARPDWPSITLTALAGVYTKPPAGTASRGRQPLTATQRVAHGAEAKRHHHPGRRLGSTGGAGAGHGHVAVKVLGLRGYRVEVPRNDSPRPPRGSRTGRTVR